MLDAEVAAGLIAACSGGIREVLGALEGEALLVVDLRGDRIGWPGPVPLALPLVVVGVGDGQASPAAEAVDVALTTTPSPPRPWVQVADTEAALGRLAETAEATPVASVTLAQVLRAGSGSLEHDLLVESLAYSTLQAAPEFAAWLDKRPERQSRPARDPVLVERAGDRIVVTLNRPEVRNAYSAAVRDGLCEALAVALADPSVRRVELRGAGPDFCSGGDLNEFGTFPDPATAHLVRTGRSAARLLGQLAGRVTAFLQGACVGAGIELPALAARVIATPDAWMALPEVGMGLIPGAGGTATLPRRIGRHRTAWLALSGERLDAATALVWGLVDGIEPAG